MSRALCVTAALLGLFSWAVTIDTAAAQSGAVASGSTISVCNTFPVRIFVALASENQGNFSAAGWWSVEPNACEPADFPLQGAALYYTADSDQFTQGNTTSREHWGNKTNLYVSDQKFSFDNAQTNRNGAHGEMFSSVELTPQQQNAPVAITFHFGTGGSQTDITIKK